MMVGERYNFGCFRDLFAQGGDDTKATCLHSDAIGAHTMMVGKCYDCDPR